MEIVNFTALKKANRLKADILEIAYFFNEERKQEYYNINLLDELYSNRLIENDKYKELTELFENIYNEIEKAEKEFLNVQIKQLNNKKR